MVLKTCGYSGCDVGFEAKGRIGTCSPECQRLRKNEIRRSSNARSKRRIKDKIYYNKPGKRDRRRNRQRISDRARRKEINERKSQRDKRKFDLPNTYTTKDRVYAIEHFNGCCAVCGKQLMDLFGDFFVAMDHWVPVSYKGEDNPGTVPGNIVPLCHGIGGCNNSKGSTMPAEWLERRLGKRKGRLKLLEIEAYFKHVRGLES